VKLNASVLQLVQDSLHGWGVKSVALVARVIFLVLIVPGMPEGELGLYVYISSTALILSLILSMGMVEELPRLISGDHATATRYFRWFYLLSFAVATAIGVFSLFPSVPSGIALATVTLVTNSYWGGLNRSIDPAIHRALRKKASLADMVVGDIVKEI
jgi:O-antigen/teichoic acid export membrane protein